MSTQALPRNAGRPWTVTTDTQLRSLFNSGTELRKIAIEMGRTLPGIQARCERLGLLIQAKPATWSEPLGTKNALNGVRLMRRADTIFLALPRSLWTEAGRCNCQHCKGGMAYWDTLAIDTRSEGAYEYSTVVHMPEAYREADTTPDWKRISAELRDGLLKLHEGLTASGPYRKRIDVAVELIRTLLLNSTGET